MLVVKEGRNVLYRIGAGPFDNSLFPTRADETHCPTDEAVVITFLRLPPFLPYLEEASLTEKLTSYNTVPPI
jgi:hypothetical protein